MTTTTANLAGLLEGYFSRRLMQQRQASPHTIASYRDTFRLLTGVKGEIAKTWSYDAYAAHSFTKEGQTGTGQVNVMNFMNALSAVADVDDALAPDAQLLKSSAPGSAPSSRRSAHWPSPTPCRSSNPRNRPVLRWKARFKPA